MLFAARTARLFAYGFLAVVLVLYLAQTGLSGAQVGLLLTLALLGDAVLSLWITINADRIGRRTMLLAGAALMLFAGLLFVVTRNFIVLLAAATIGVISPSGNEIGPFLAIELSSLSQIVPEQRRINLFAWYNLVGSFATALGALSGGVLAQLLQQAGFSPLESYRVVLVGYAAMGIVLAAFFWRLSPAIETPSVHQPALGSRFGLHKSRRVVFKLSAFFSLDAFAGGLIITSFLAYWFNMRFGAEPAVLGAIFFGTNILAGISALSAARIARRFGLINTMVFTHIPSNILLMFIPLMPTLPLAILVLLMRASISQMDVPTRQSYTMAVVSPDERSAAAGITGIARTAGATLAPVLAAPLLGTASLAAIPFFLAGGLKIVYDLLLYHSFRAIRPAGDEPPAD